jgi:phosphohistidine phosphatase
MNLYILRHGLAVDRGAAGYPNDEDRPLTAKGKRKLRKIANAMKSLKLKFDLILSSPYTRARQTAETVVECLGQRRKLEFSEDLVPGGSTEDLIQYLNRLKSRADDVMLVGHEPYLSGLISLLVSGDSDFRVVMKKGGLCKLSVQALKHGRCAAFEWLLTPKQMAAMG